jgi:hypothetical protein
MGRTGQTTDRDRNQQYSNSVSTRLFFLTLNLSDVVRSGTVPTACFGTTLCVQV